MNDRDDRATAHRHPFGRIALSIPLKRPEAAPDGWARSAVIARRLSVFANLSEEDMRVVHALDGSLRHHGARTELCVQGENIPSRALVSGWACREVVLSDGRKQIVSFLLPGDLLGILTTPPRRASCTVLALTPGATVDVEVLRGMAERGDSTGFARALHGLQVAEEVMLRDQVVRLGRQTAYERIAHLLLELHDRLALVSLTEGARFAIPLTQEAMADALGLSVVHVNRVVQQMRREATIEWRGGAVTLLRRAELIATADWMPLPVPRPTRPGG